MSTSRVPLVTAPIAWTALRMRLRMTCCSWTRSPWMRARPSASCVRTETPFFSASLGKLNHLAHRLVYVYAVYPGRRFLHERTNAAHDGAGPIVVLHSAGKRFPDLHQIRRGFV